MGKKSRLKKQRVKSKQQDRPTSAGYLSMGLLGLCLGLILGLVGGKTIPVVIIMGLTFLIFMLLFNRVLLFFGFGPNSGATPVKSGVDNYLTGSDAGAGGSSYGSGGGTGDGGGCDGGGGGGGGGDAG